MSELVKITYTNSAIGRNYRQKRTIKALGFRHLNQSRIVEYTPTIQGMVRKVSHLVEVEALPNAGDKAVTEEAVESTEALENSAGEAVSPVAEASDAEGSTNEPEPEKTSQSESDDE